MCKVKLETFSTQLEFGLEDIVGFKWLTGKLIATFGCSSD